MSDTPYIVGVIEASHVDGLASLQLHPVDDYRRPVCLYAWSDGLVTWRRERTS